MVKGAEMNRRDFIGLMSLLYAGVTFAKGKTTSPAGSDGNDYDQLIQILLKD